MRADRRVKIRLRLRRLFALFLCTVAVAPAFAQENAAASNPIDYTTAHLSRVLTALRVSETIGVDGRLDEPAWQRAVPASNFLQRRPQAGQPSHERTDVRILYDDDNLYVGYWCFDSDAGHMVITGLEEDFRTTQSDGVTLTIDPLHDRQSGFEFSTNPIGAKHDTQFSNNGAINNPDWDGVWDVKTTRTSEGWFAEFVIPFKTLRFSDSPSQEWGLNLGRRIIRVNEVSAWAPIPIRYNSYRVEIAGTLTGLEGIRQGRNLAFKPFLTGGMTQSRGPDGRLQTLQAIDRLADQNAGIDVKYSVTPSLTLDATYRTDFAQVEVDQQQVNLTRFNVFFPEKRDFFLENAGIFTVGQGSFTFGGAGSNRNLLPFFSRRIGLSPSGTPIPIVGGVRLSGRVRDYEVGFLEMQTEEQGAVPANNYLVGRVRRNLRQTSWIGAMVTNRDSSQSGDYNRLFGTDAHFQFFEKLDLDGYLLQTDTPGRSGSSQARRFQTVWNDDELRVNGEYNTVQPNFNPELGFVPRPDMEQFLGEISWEPQFPASPTFRSLSFASTVNYYQGSASGLMETRVRDGSAVLWFDDGRSISLIAQQTFDRLRAPLRIPAGNPRVAVPAGDYQYVGYQAQFVSAQRMIMGTAAFNWGDFYNGERSGFSGSVNMTPGHHLILNAGWDRNNIAVAGGAFRTDLLRTRATYAFNPRTVVHAFIQYNTDTNQVASNIRFNWTYRPLSDLYIVYNDTRATPSGLTRERALIVKLTNLISF